MSQYSRPGWLPDCQFLLGGTCCATLAFARPRLCYEAAECKSNSTVALLSRAWYPGKINECLLQCARVLKNETA